MISKNQQKRLRALGQKKQRKLLGQFLVQGEKNVMELLASNLNVKQIFATPEFVTRHSDKLQSYPVTEADEATLSKLSTITSNNAAIAIVEIPKPQTLPNSGIILALDGVADPGNLGTIIRLADWYGVKHIVCSQDSADAYNPKTISATMGSFARISVITTDLTEFLANANLPIYGAYLGGQSVHQSQFKQDAILLMGSESHGIRAEAGQFVTNKITIPSFGQAESLNVAMATGIILDNIKRAG